MRLRPIPFSEKKKASDEEISLHRLLDVLEPTKEDRSTKKTLYLVPMKRHIYKGEPNHVAYTILVIAQGGIVNITEDVVRAMGLSRFEYPQIIMPKVPGRNQFEDFINKLERMLYRDTILKCTLNYQLL